MKIVLISNYLPDVSTSMLHYARMLERALAARGHHVTVIRAPALLGALPFVRGPIAKWIWYLDKFVSGSLFLRWKCRGADVVHVCDHSNSMYLRCSGPAAGILTCHDLLAVNAARDLYDGVRIGRTGRLYQRWIAAGIASADNLICVSNKTKEDLLELAPGIKAEISVIPHPLNFDYGPADPGDVRRVRKKTGLEADAEYLFHIGGNQWYKNRLTVLKIFAELKRMQRFERTKLVMAGRPWTREMHAFRHAALSEGDAFELIDISTEDLQALYSGALALLFPSREEGFGWPVLEAQACGCPVITTSKGPMTEVAGGAALLVDPSDPRAAAETIGRGVDALPELREAGFRNVAQYTVDRAIDAYLAAYERAIARNRSQPAG